MRRANQTVQFKRPGQTSITAAVRISPASTMALRWPAAINYQYVVRWENALTFPSGSPIQEGDQILWSQIQEASKTATLRDLTRSYEPPYVTTAYIDSRAQ